MEFDNYDLANISAALCDYTNGKHNATYIGNRHADGKEYAVKLSSLTPQMLASRNGDFSHVREMLTRVAVY